MTDKHDPLEDIDLEDLEAALEELVEHSRRCYAMARPGLYYDVPRDYKGLEEESVCEALRESLAAQGECNIRNIRKYRDPDNPKKDLFPDCLAEIDGKTIGIEVSELRRGQTCEPWSLEKFQECLQSIISDKHEKAQIDGREKFVASLHRLYVVIPTDELFLPDVTIQEYLQQIRLPKPSHIDKAFVLGSPEARDDPVIRGQAHEAEDKKPRCTAFRILWSENS